MGSHIPLCAPSPVRFYTRYILPGCVSYVLQDQSKPLFLHVYTALKKTTVLYYMPCFYLISTAAWSCYYIIYMWLLFYNVGGVNAHQLISSTDQRKRTEKNANGKIRTEKQKSTNRKALTVITYIYINDQMERLPAWSAAAWSLYTAIIK